MKLSDEQKAVLTKAAAQLAEAHGITSAAAADRIREKPTLLNELVTGLQVRADEYKRLLFVLAPQPDPPDPKPTPPPKPTSPTPDPKIKK